MRISDWSSDVCSSDLNGAGKSTLFRMLMGKETPDSGSIEIGDTVQLACVDQSRDDLDGGKTVWEAVSDGLDQIRRSEERREGKASVSTCRSRWSPEH